MQTAPGISPMLQTRPRNAPAPHCPLAAASPLPPRRQTRWTATDDPARPRSWLFLFLVVQQLTQMLFGLLHIVQAKPAAFDQMGHDRLRLAAEHRQEVVDQPPPCGIA